MRTLALLGLCAGLGACSALSTGMPTLASALPVAPTGQRMGRFPLGGRALHGPADFGDHLVAQASDGLNRSSSLRPISTPPHRLSLQQHVYLMLTSVFVTCLIIADVIGVKIFQLQLPFPILGHTSVEHTCGMLTFPITFVLGDVINEYYGPRATKSAVYVGFAMSVLVFFALNAAQAMPFLQKPFNVSPEAFNMIFGSAKLMYIASVSAYLVGQLADIWLFGVIKRLTKGKLLWLRATGSTVISQMIDSFVVSYIAFSLGKTWTNQPPASMPEVLQIAVTGYGLKFVLAALLTPLLYLARFAMHRYFDLEPLPVDYEED